MAALTFLSYEEKRHFPFIAHIGLLWIFVPFTILLGHHNGLMLGVSAIDPTFHSAHDHLSWICSFRTISSNPIKNRMRGWNQ